LVVEVVVVVEDEVVGGVAAAGVEVELDEAELPPHAANTKAAKIMQGSALFIKPTPVLDRKTFTIQGTRHPRRRNVSPSAHGKPHPYGPFPLGRRVRY
jgi:hypothetical protein